ncbi:MAG: T9SS type A sorting domain-containing protein [Balneolaceae bacterium]|nr:T9SS type A sorting domain-containing protein [Balneolaceae bacterium]
MKQFLLLIGISLCFLGTSFGQSAGDIAFVGFNADGDDDFAIVVLSDIAANSTIYFTDEEINASGDGLVSNTEGTLQWDTGGSIITAGTIITFYDASNTDSSSIGSLSEPNAGFNLGASGEALIAFIGTDHESPTSFLAGISNGGSSAYGDLTNSGLEVGTTAVNLASGSDGGIYEGVKQAVSKADFLAAVNDASKWSTNSSDGETFLPFSTDSFEFTNTRQITGSAGWRLLSLPITGGTIEDVSDDTPVQGVSGGDDASADANFIIYDSDATFEQPTNVTETWGDGLGFGLYFFNNTTNGSSTLPVTMDVSGSEPSSDVAVTLNPAASGYTLVGNPFGSNFNTNNLVSSVAAIQNTIHFWDGSSYQSEDRTASSGYIVAPWQGFWVQKDASGDAATLTLPVTGKDTSSTSGTYFKSVEARGDIEFTLSSETTIDEALRIAFRNDATFDYDIDDAGKLTPLIPAYATMAIESNEMLKSVESLPYNLEEEVTLSLQPQLVGVSGEFTFGWNGLETIPSEWELILHDYDTGESIDMRSQSEYVFSAGAQAKANPNPLNLLTGPAAVAMKSKAENNRFGITIRPTAVSNETEDSPEVFALEQNYPNPFNPSTTISYSVQEAGAVNISVYNLMGQKVATLVNETKAAGQYNVRWNAAGAASGMYYYRLEAGGQSITRKMTLIK